MYEIANGTLIKVAPIVPSQAVYYNDDTLDNKLDGKVDKVQGKTLSSNDYTNADKTKLDSLPIKAELDTSLASKQPAITTSDAYARVTDDIFAVAAAKNITIAST